MNLRNLLLTIFLGLAFFSPFANATTIPSYTVNGDGTVTDATTGLTWKRCSEGQIWTGNTCSGTANTYTWAQAVALTSSFSNRNDWRLPNIRELQTIVDRTVYNPSINSSIFPNTSASRIWSASSYSSSAWYVGFGYGDSYYYGNKSNSFQVRLVRGGQPFGLLGLSRPGTYYSDNGGGTVSHTPTGLIWKRCSEGQTWTGITCSGSASTYTWNQAIALTSSFAGNSDWRIPTEEELISLVDYTILYPGPTINTKWFPNTGAGDFWSASINPGYSGAWHINFGYGYAYDGNKAHSFKVRLVRGGQSFDLWALAAVKTGDGNGTVTSSPVGINCGSGGSDCTESYSSRTNVTLTATPESGSEFTGWSGDCTGSSNTCTVTMVAAKSVTATFDLITHTLIVTRLGTGSGAVSSSVAGINCGTDCMENYAPNTFVTLTAVATTGSTFTGWSGVCSGVGTCSVSMIAAKSVSANFSANQIISNLQFRPVTLTLGGSTTASATTNSGLAVIFSSLTPSLCTTSGINGSTIVSIAAGTCTIAANQSGNASYNSAPQVTKNFIVLPASQTIGTITFAPATLALGSSTKASASATSRLPVGFSSSTQTICAVSGNTITSLAAGVCTIAANQTGNANYSAAPQVTQRLTINKVPQTIGAISFTPSTLALDGTTAASALATSGLPVSFTSTTPSICTVGGINGSTIINLAAGTCTIVANQAGNTNYYAASEVTKNVTTIAKSNQIIGTMTFTPATLRLGGATAVRATATSRLPVKFRSLSLDICIVNGSTVTSIAVGTCTIAANQSGNATYKAAPQKSKSIIVSGGSQHTLLVIKSGSGTISSNPVGINCGTDCEEGYSSGASVTLTATPGNGSTFTGWNGGGCIGTATTCVVNVTATKAVSATFSTAWPLTVIKLGAGNGTVISNPSGISCGADCTAYYASGVSVTLMATVPTGSTFSGWSGGCAGNNESCTVNVAALTSVIATFNAASVTYPLIVTKSGTGNGTVVSTPAGINCEANCSNEYSANTSITLKATPSSHSTFTGWSGGCSGTLLTCKVTVTKLTSVVATFVAQLPDFVVTGIKITPNSPDAGSSFNVQVTIQNQGAVPGDPGSLAVWVNQPMRQNCNAEGDANYAAGTIGVLAVGANKIVNVPFDGLVPELSVGPKILRAFIDSRCAAHESVETNNQLTKRYSVQ